MKIDVRTPDGQHMTWQHATLPLGSALRIAPAFTATATAEDISVETTIHTRFDTDAGRYMVTATAHRPIEPAIEITPAVLRQVRLGELLSAAVPYCVAVDDNDLGTGTVRELRGEGERLLPAWMTEMIAQAGPTANTLEIVQLLYGIAALAARPPIVAVAAELGISERTARHWIGKARRAGLLDGIRYTVGRQPDGAHRPE
ncbi:hypothetical protein [Leifsonia sp. TF02-11]|uniref:hypothetical protein n=1 Tax=Leifsonia sp. TF02-11 TaxID=2815212 RepID=UPI001AA14182|nr:hypothetical protein [Leifsonia sp. TF02-11]MBO1740725.1 hypothetical protein [Leifsonia sp. TF02-11]